MTAPLRGNRVCPLKSARAARLPTPPHDNRNGCYLQRYARRDGTIIDLRDCQDRRRTRRKAPRAINTPPVTRPLPARTLAGRGLGGGEWVAITALVTMIRHLAEHLDQPVGLWYYPYSITTTFWLVRERAVPGVVHA